MCDPIHGERIATGIGAVRLWARYALGIERCAKGGPLDLIDTDSSPN